MAKPRKSAGSPRKESQDSPATLKDLIRPEMLDKLKEQAKEMKEAEERQREEKRKQAEEARRAEQKRLENDFGHLLENSGLDWRNYK